MTRQNTVWTEDIPALKIEAMEGGCVIVECEDPYGNGDASISLHPMHLRLIAEKMGLVQQLSASEADNLRTIDKLARRLRVLHGRIAQAHEWLWQNADRGFDQCDINIEAWYIDATLDMANEFLAEMEEAGIVETPRRAIPPLSRGDVKNPAQTQQEPSRNPRVSGSPNPPIGAAEGGRQNPPSVARRTPVEPSPKACANPSGKASAKASVEPSEPRTDSLFGGGHE